MEMFCPCQISNALLLLSILFQLVVFTISIVEYKYSLVKINEPMSFFHSHFRQWGERQYGKYRITR